MQHQENGVTDVFKDVVIIGNGPSGICLSYLLAGNWPHYSGSAHPGDDMLTARLRYSVATQTPTGNDVEDPEEPVDEDPVRATTTTTTVPGARATRRRSRGSRSCLARSSRREDLEYLSAGLEGRNAGKPLSLLMDQLQHPCLDAGLDEPPLLDWLSAEEHADHKLIDHVVLGKGPPGGTWHSLDPNVLTISLSRWMSLPGLDLRHWQSSLASEERKQKPAYLGKEAEIGTDYRSSRVPIGTVATYYKDYVAKQGLDEYFRCGTVVTSVRPVPGVPDGETEFGWSVLGYEAESGRRFSYRCKRVVLASGTTDSFNRLSVPGEDTYNWVTHDFKDFERKLDRSNSPLRTSLQINDQYDTDELKSNIEPVLIVGSGLSAADAIMAARFRGVPVLHVFRSHAKDPQQQNQHQNDRRERSKSLDRLQWLPASMYPEYHEVYEMMADRGRSYTLYKSLPDHVVVDFSSGTDKYARAKTRKVTLCTPQGRLISYRVSFAAILIGSKPDLSYLQNNGTGLGKLQDKPIDSRLNPIDIDVFSYEIEKAPRKGLYAIGPLAGDNFIRFILGGAFGVFANILNLSE